MPNLVERPANARKATQHMDENGVPTISSSVPLALLGLGVFASVPLMALHIFRTLLMAATGEVSDGEETWELLGNYRRMLWITGALRILFLGWMCVAAYHFFSRRAAAPRMLIVLYACSIGLNMIEGVWEASFADGDQAYAGAAMAAAIGPSFISAIWIVYLWRSRQVQRVFVYPLPSEQPCDEV